MVSKSPKWRCSPSKWPQWLVNEGYIVAKYLPAVMILQVHHTLSVWDSLRSFVLFHVSATSSRCAAAQFSTSTTTPLGSMTQQALHRCAITCRAHRFHPVDTTMANPWTSNHHKPLTYNNDLIKSHFLETTVKDTYLSSVLSLSHHHPLEAGTNAICHPLGEALVVHPHTGG